MPLDEASDAEDVTVHLSADGLWQNGWPEVPPPLCASRFCAPWGFLLACCPISTMLLPAPFRHSRSNFAMQAPCAGRPVAQRLQRSQRAEKKENKLLKGLGGSLGLVGGQF